MRAARALIALGALVLIPRVGMGQAGPTDSTRIRLQVGRFPHALLRLREPAALRAPWLGAPVRSPAAAVAAWDSSLAVTLRAARLNRARTQRRLTLYGRQALADSLEAAAGDTARRGILGVSERYADVDLEAQARFEIRTDRLKNERCTPIEALDPNSGCRAKFKAPRLENEFTILAGGVLGQRVHINVDWDTQREVSASNTVQVYYEGLQDEIVRRVEVGTVTFQLPPSRFITSSIPTNNFGVNARVEVGPVQVQALAATQEGSQVAERRFSIGATTSEPQDRTVRDKDFESGRFYWVVDPLALPNYPAVDILNLEPSQVPAAARPTDVRVYRFRPRAGETGADPSLGGINAFAMRGGNETGVGARWQLLLQNTDYYLDASGLWIVLGTKLASDEYLAVSYLTAGATRVGTFPGSDRGFGPNNQYLDSLQLVGAPQVQPGESIFPREMRQVYRIAGTDLERSTLSVQISLNRSERPLSGGADTYLALLGLALPTDPSVIDIDNRVFPRTRDAGAVQTVREAYIVFPHLRPFADQNKLPTVAERQDSLYRTPTYLVLGSQGPPSKYEFRLKYEAAGGTDRSSVTLNALQISEGSEHLTYNGRPLERGVDYEIDYGLGLVTFADPDGLFGVTTGTLVVTFEERGFFAIAPTSIFGLTTTYRLGEAGTLNLIGLYQQEQSAFTRPPLGFEPTASFIGGITTDLRFQPQAVTDFLDHLTSTPTTAPSTLDLNAEFAVSRPVANRIGQAYLDEFERDAGIRVGLGESAWEFGSIPQRTDGLNLPGFGVTFDTASAVQMTWQNLIIRNGMVVAVRPQQIDPGIVIAGQGESQETVMYLTLHADTAGGQVRTNNSSGWSRPARPGPRFRSMVTPLSTTGLDLSSNQYLEFWVFTDTRFATPADADARFIFDLGTVNEDALALAPDTVTVTGADSTYRGLQYVGVGKLDTERSPTGIFNAQTDDIGILGDRPDSLFIEGQGYAPEVPLCQRGLSNSVPVFPWGDLSGRCTNRNGFLDTEDLNNDDLLNFNASSIPENVFRWVVNPNGMDKYFVRTGVVSAEGTWRLYRIPLADPDAILGTPNIRLIQHLRVTVAAPDLGGDDVVARWGFARMRLTGAPWINRAPGPIDGISGSVANPTGSVVVTTISTVDQTDLGYSPPPGVINQTDRTDSPESLGTQINETSLRIFATDPLLGDALPLGARAEALNRFTAGPQNMLSYRELRLWLRGRGPGWTEGDLEGYVKLGTDDRNFYLYRTPVSANGVGPAAWGPEVVVDLDVWRRLRGAVETAWLRGEPPSGSALCGLGDSTAYIACDGPYVVHMADPGINPPNLAAVQEVAAGILRVASTVTVDTAEIWVDDVRLTDPVNQVGTALALDARLAASDVGDLRLAYTRRGGQFRQLGDDPTYQTTSDFQAGGTVRMERFLPPSLGVFAPVTVAYTRSSTTPELLRGTDIVATDLEGLRTPESWNATVSLAVRRSARGSGWVTRGFVDPLSLSATLTDGAARTELSNSTTKSMNLGAVYNLALNSRGFKLPFGFVDGLPDWLSDSEAGEGLKGARLSLVPRSIRWSSRLARTQSEYTTYAVPIFRAGDDALRPVLNESHTWVNSAGLTLQPLGMLTMSGDLTSTRDLRRYPDSTSIGRLANASRKSLLGLDVGVERLRTFTSQLSLSPRINAWLRPRLTSGSIFSINRDLASRDPVRVEGDSAGAFLLPQTFNNSRTRELAAAVEPSVLVRRIFGDSSVVTKALSRIRTLDLSTRTTRTSTFDLATFKPSLGYQLALGGTEDFLRQDGEIARGANEVITNQVSAGANLPLGIQASVSYSLVRTFQYTRVDQDFLRTRIRAKEWPVGNVRWNGSFTGGPISILGLGTTFRKVEGTTVVPRIDGGRAGVSLNRSTSVMPDLNIGFRNGVAATLGYALTNQTTQNNGNTTEVDLTTLTGSVNYAFPLPRSISPRGRLVRTALSVLDSRSSSCLQRSGEEDCNTITDIRRQELRASLDTDVSRLLQGGLQLSYAINDARHIDRRTSQIIISLNFSLSLFAGDFR